jgi:PUA-domain protein
MDTNIYCKNLQENMQRKQLRAKDVNREIAHFGIAVHKKDTIELLDNNIIIVNKEPHFFYFEEKLIPTLKFLIKAGFSKGESRRDRTESSGESECLKKITVDMGAIKFVTSGADVMRPGITGIEPGIVINEPVVIVDETHKKPIAVGIALVDSVEMENVQKGKVVKIIHYVGDDVWNI